MINFRSVRKLLTIITGGVLIFYLVYTYQIGYVYSAMTSTSYQITTDSINTGGGLNSTSSNYYESDTIGEIATGNSTSTSYSMYAGFWTPDSNNVYISIQSPGGNALPAISGLTAASSVASSSWIVTTNNSTGYSLTISASTSPALRILTGSSFDDYVPSGPDPDFNFAISPNASAFAFSPEGVDIISKYKDNGSACNIGALDTLMSCWDGLATTSKQISTSNTSNHPSGATTTVEYKVEVGSNKIQDSGAYNATIIVTATTL